jgi:two-component system, sensor histidine kinase
MPAIPQRRRVLIVDDHLDIAVSMAMLLEALGQQVEVATSGTEALAKAVRIRPEIVFLDIGLPDMDGFQVAARLRDLKDLQPLRIIALTAYGSAEAKRLAVEAGCDMHVTKPLDPNLLPALL